MCILTIHNVLKYWSYSLKNANNICVGRRKSSIARVLYKRGNGKLVINGADVLEYFKRESLVMMLNQPFDLVEFDKKYNLEEIKNVLSTSPGCKVVDEHRDGGILHQLKPKINLKHLYQELEKMTLNLIL